MYVFKQHEDLLTELRNGSSPQNFSTPRTSVGDIAVSNFAGTQLRYYYLRAISNAFGRDLRTLVMFGLHAGQKRSSHPNWR